MSHVPTIRARHLAWLPAALLISAGVLSAVGVSLTPNGRAATATGTTNISATVLPEISLDLAQNLAGASTCGVNTDATANAEVFEFGNAGARIPINASGSTALGTCNMTFGTNNGSSGASLTYKSARAGATANRTFCTTAAALSCAGTYYTDDDGANTTLEADRFGIKMETASSCQTQVMVDDRYYGAPLAGGTAQDVCTGEAASATPANDGFAQLTFEVNTSTVASGNYNAQIVFTATAN